MRAKLLFGVVIAAGMLLAQIARAQDARIHRIGAILQGGSWYSVIDGLREGLNQSGFVEGKQFVLDIRDAGGDLKAVEEAAKDLERRKVDLIYTAATSVSVATKQATQAVPIVFVAGTNPVAVKLVESIPAPGGRLTGVHLQTTDVTGKRLELLREIIPKLRRVVTFYNPNNPAAAEAARLGRAAAQHLGFEFMERQAASVEELRRVVQSFKAGDADAFFSVSDAMIDSQIETIIAMANAIKLPTMLYESSEVEKGGLASYSADFREGGRLAAKHVRRILAGMSPANLPVEQSDKLMFVINLKTAKLIGLAIPETMLVRADKVIE